MLQGSLLDPVDSARVLERDVFAGRRQGSSKLPGLSPVRPIAFRRRPPVIGYLNRFIGLDQSQYLPDDILYKVDRMSMAHSLEVRPPFLDHRIVEFAATTAGKFKDSRIGR